MPDDPQDWRSALSEDIKSHPSLEPYKLGEGEAMVQVPPGLIKSYVGQQKLIGMDKLPIPGENAGPEDWDVVWSRLGRPETPDKYELKPPDDLPEQVKVSDELMTEYRTEAHKLGILPKQAQGLLEWFLGANAKEIQALDQQGKEYKANTEATLRKKWGKAYPEKVSLATNTFAHLGSQIGEDSFQSLSNLMDETGLGDHPLMLEFFSKVGELIGEDVITGKPRTSFALTPEQATAEIAKIQGDPKHPYYQKDHPEHNLAVRRMAELHEMEAAAEGK